MDKQQAAEYLRAANENPFVAAWISILDSHSLPYDTPVLPHDWWDSFQELYLHGLIEEERFQNIDIDKTFFSERRPKLVELSAALFRLHGIRTSEEHMPKHDLATFDPFEQAISQPEPQRRHTAPDDLFAPEPQTGFFEPSPAIGVDGLRREIHQRTMDDAECGIRVLCCGAVVPLRPADATSGIQREQDQEFSVVHGECGSCGGAFHYNIAEPDEVSRG